MLTPTFHFKILDNFIPIFNRNAKLLTEKFASTGGSAVDVDSYVSLCTLDIICGKFDFDYFFHSEKYIDSIIEKYSNLYRNCNGYQVRISNG